ncbi:MAG: hypothetical protein AAF429_09210 [Pseudomonadota bacterium]
MNNSDNEKELIARPVSFKISNDDLRVTVGYRWNNGKQFQKTYWKKELEKYNTIYPKPVKEPHAAE